MPNIDTGYVRQVTMERVRLRKMNRLVPSKSMS